jgi:alcohol dehydrogenase (NADP+)
MANDGTLLANRFFHHMMYIHLFVHSIASYIDVFAGCQPVSWQGSGAFPWLLHHPNGVGSGAHHTDEADSYYKEKLRLQQGNERHDAPGPAGGKSRRGNVGTWDGPAPRGQGIVPRHAQDNPEIPKDCVQVSHEPDCIVLRGGVRMPLLGLGTFRMTEAASVKKALELGYRHFDCARIYGNEDVIGQGMKDYLESSPDARASLWITSKVWNDAHRPEEVVKSVDATLRDLGCDYLDLLLIHWPDAWIPGSQEEPDNTVTIQETYTAMERLVDEGRVKFLGVSNFSLRQVEDVLTWCKHKPIVNQIELHPMLPQRKLVGVCLRKGVHSVAYSPLGHGVSKELLEHPTVTQVAQETGKSNAQVLLKWNLQRGIAVIPKASGESHLRDNIEGMWDWKLTWDQKSLLDSLEKVNKRFVDPSFHKWDDVELGGAEKPSTKFHLN